jgi:hypothetical protein
MTDPINTPTPAGRDAGGAGITASTVATAPAGPGGPSRPMTASGGADEPGRPRRRGGIGRILKWAFLLTLLLLIGGGIFLWLNLNRIVKHTVETQSTAQLNLKTELDGAAVSLFGQELNLNDLKIASPQGYSAPQMFRLDGADVKVKVAELRQDPVRVQSITLNRPKLVIENNGGTFNFRKAMDMMPKSPTPPPDQKPLRLTIADLTVKDPTVVIRPGKINIPGLNLPEEITLNIPTVTLKNVGTSDDAQNGAAIKDVVMQVITVMAANAANSGQLPDELKNLLNVDVQQVVAGLTAEAQKRIAAALPGEAGRIVSAVIADPQALLKDPGKVVGAQVEQLRGQAEQEAQKRLGGLIGQVTGQPGNTGATQPSTQPATQPADRVKQEADKAVRQGLDNLLNRGNKPKNPNR